jgi:predicted cupin superfamily sugar epimerase
MTQWKIQFAPMDLPGMKANQLRIQTLTRLGFVIEKTPVSHFPKRNDRRVFHVWHKNPQALTMLMLTEVGASMRDIADV